MEIQSFSVHHKNNQNRPELQRKCLKKIVIISIQRVVSRLQNGNFHSFCIFSALMASLLRELRSPPEQDMQTLLPGQTGCVVSYSGISI